MLLMMSTNLDAKALIARNVFVKEGFAGFGRNHVYKYVGIRNNVFASPVKGLDVHQADRLDRIEISNNTFLGRDPISFVFSPPMGEVIICNNLRLRAGLFRLAEGAEERRQDVLSRWHVAHNSYPRESAPEDGWPKDQLVPKFDSDLLGIPKFLSKVAGDADFLRPVADDPVANAGLGGDWPAYLGALPPGPAPKEGDWFTRLRERWTDVGWALPSSESATGHVQTTTDHDKPFVVVRGEGKERKEFKRFTEAIAVLRDGDAIEIHGNGPFSIPRLRLDNKGLSIRAAPGYRPVLMAKDKFNYNGPWFEVHGGTITLEGCDFFSGDADVAFLGEGPPWEWRNCRFVTGGRLASLAGHGQRLTVRDSLIWAMDRTGTSTIQCQSATQIVLINNVVQSRNHGIGLDSTKGGLVMTLTNNTVVNGNRGSWLLLRQLEGDAQPVEIDAVGNLFDLPWMYADVASPLIGDLVGDFDAATMKQLVEQGKLRWQGRDNLYCGSKAPAVEAGKDRIAEGLAAWRAFWGADEAGSMETPDVSFAWDSPRLLPTQEAIVWLRDVVERAKQNEAKTLPDLGPDWDLIGPGEAYLRALAARGQPVPAEKLRPEPPEDGPFVVLRNGEPAGAHVTLGQAVAAAQSGDTIEIRTDGPFSGCGIAPGCSLVIRAAPGYLPILEGDLRYLHAGELTLEGIHFRGVEGIPRSGCGITCDAGSCDALHVVNCSFEDNAQRNAMSLYVVAWRDKEHSEIINCWVSGTASILADAGSSFLIRNSVMCRLSLNLVNMGEDGARACHIERSVVWPWDGGFAAFHPSERLTVADTWIEGDLAPESFQPGSLKNDRNLYRTGIFDLVERLRVESRSGDKGSIVVPPLTFDPLQWRLLPDSPFYQVGPDGKDFGADVTRIGTLTPLPPPAGADSAAPSAASATNPLDSRPPAATVVALDDERALGKWVVEQGGRVGTGSLCTVPVREIWLTDNGSIGDDSLARFQHCPRLTLLDLNATAVSDQGLPQLSSIASLRRLDLRNTDVSDAGLKNLAGLTRLEWLDLARTHVSDTGLNDLATVFPWLRYLSLEGDSISDAGLPALAALAQLDRLDLSGTEVTDAGLSHLRPLTGLARLSLSDTTVSDAAIATLQTDLVDCWIIGADGAIHAPPDRDDGSDRKAVDLWLQTGATMALTTDGVGEADYVAANRPTGPFRVRGIQAGENAFGDADMALVAQLRQLRFARFPYVQITNRGLNCLKDLPKLEQFSALGCTRSTGGGLAVLATLPRLRHVRVNRDCGAAGLRHVLALANLESLVLEGEIVGGDMLERLAGLKQLQSLDLSATRVTGTGLAHLAELPHLSSLALHATNLSAADISRLAELRGLESLTLTRFPVSAEVLRPLEKLPRLWHLFLENTSLDDDGFEAIGRLTSLEFVSVNDATDAGLAQIANLSRLRMLYVNGPTITDAGLERIARLPHLQMLELGGPITDAGLAHLQELATLETLRLAGVSVSESGVAAFKAALPGCNVEFPHGVPWQK